MCIGQVFVDEKSNEIPATKDLFKIIDLKDTIVTLDALNTQKTTIEVVIKNKGDYVGALKGNQGNLYNDVKEYFDEEELQKIRREKENYVVTKEKEHSAIVTREYFLTENIKWIYGRKAWKGLKSIGVKKKTIEKKNGDKTLQIVKKIALAILRTVQTFYKVSLKMIRFKL